MVRLGPVPGGPPEQTGPFRRLSFGQDGNRGEGARIKRTPGCGSLAQVVLMLSMKVLNCATMEKLPGVQSHCCCMPSRTAMVLLTMASTGASGYVEEGVG